jgi:hypothetical protein
MSRLIDDGMLSPTDADRLLKRASELDMSRSAAVSIEQLRQSAIDAGIDASAFDAALRELRSEPTVSEAVVRPTKPAGLRLLASMSVFGLALGGLTQVFHPNAYIDGLHVDRIGATAVLMSAFAYLLMRRAPAGRHGPFQRDLFALFASFMLGSSLMSGSVLLMEGGRAAVMSFIAGWIWAGSAVLGAGLIALMKRSGLSADPIDPAAPQELPAVDRLQNDMRPENEARTDSSRFEVRRGITILPA